MKNILILVAVAAAIGGFFVLASFLGGGEKVQSEKPLIVCNPPQAPSQEQKCFWTAHIHAAVQVFKGGELVNLGFEQGKLEEEHTHVETDLIHWHGLIPVDPLTKEVKDWSSLRVDKIPADLNFSLPDQPKFAVNGREVEPSYIWQDEDAVEIRY